MALTASCPSCGAPVVFQSAGSVFAVCEYCQSTLVRRDQALEDIGKMAALAEDRSPLQLGSEGVYKGVHFALIGRIQIKYSQGLWNEWHLLFDDMRTGWLSEAAGEYVLTFLKHPGEALPAFAELQAGRKLTLGGQAWTVSNKEEAECVAGQGELPFKVGAGYPLAAADLRNGKQFATLDYSETPPLWFVGEAVEFSALQLRNLRAGMPLPGATAATVAAEVFRCGVCGSPLQASSPSIVAIACRSCGTVVDAADANHAILSRASAKETKQYQPRLPLGSKGQLDGEAVEVIGFMVRRTRSEGIAYDWREYLLAAPNGRYRWLTEYNHHWNVVDVLSDPPAGGIIEVDSVRYRGESFKHFSTAQSAEVIQVAGEFTWLVRHGESCRAVDYVAPPQMLSCESTDKEITWSLGRYAAADEIAAAFALKKLPAPLGVHANQPNPWAAAHRQACRRFWRLLLLLVALQVAALSIFGSKTLLRQDFNFSPQLLAGPESTLRSREFTVTRPGSRLAVRNTTSLDNNWLALDLMLVNKTTGEAWPAAREIAYYYGSDGGESWSEGNREDEVVFVDLPAGTYYLTVDPDLAPEKPVPVNDRLEVLTAGAGWSNFILALLFIALFPVFSRFRFAAFEGARWADSDHPPTSGGDSGDDD